MSRATRVILLAAACQLASTSLRAQGLQENPTSRSADGAISRANAANVTRAHDHYVLGQNFFRARNYRDALRELELASALAPSAEVWIDIARAHEELGEYAQAISALERCSQDYAASAETEGVRARITQLVGLAHAAHQREIEQPRYGSLRVHGRAPGARVFVDDRPIAEAALAAPLLLSEGKHRFDVILPAHVPTHALVDIQPGLLTTAYADLRPTTRARTRTARHGFDFALFGVAGASALVSGTFAALSIAQRADGSLKNSQAWAERADIALAGTALCALAATVLFHAAERNAETELAPAAAGAAEAAEH